MAIAATVQVMMLHVVVSSGMYMSKSNSSVAQKDACDELHQGRVFGFRDRYCESVRTYHTIGDMMDSFRSEQQYWDAEGEVQPWNTMLTNYPKGLDIPDEDKSRFFQSGTDAARSVVTKMGRVGATPENGTVLDFGCGMGRVAQGFVAEGFNKVLCVDHSASILKASQMGLAKFGGKGPVMKSAHRQIEFVQSGPDLSCKVGAETVDFAYSMLTLQHLKPQLQVAYIEQMCDALKQGGSGFLQTATSLWRYEEDEDKEYKKEHCSLQADALGMILHYTPYTEVTRHLKKRGCKVLFSEDCPKFGDKGESTCFGFKKTGHA